MPVTPPLPTAPPGTPGVDIDRDLAGQPPQGRRRRTPALPLSDGREGYARYNRLINFAGVDSTSVLVRGERVLYAAAGVILVAYVVYAFLGTWAFAYMTAGNVIGATLAAIVIGGILIAINLSIDRGLIGYIPAKLDDPLDPRGDAAPIMENSSTKWNRRLRVILAILFALAVGEPANLFLFSRDVDAAIAARDATRISQQQQASATNYEQAAANDEAAIAAAQQQIAAIRAYPAELLAKAEQEQRGEGSSGVAGCGVQCQRFQEQAAEARATMVADIAAQQAIIDDARADLARIEAAKGQEVQTTATTTAADTGFLAREEAFYSMLTDSPLSMLRYGIIVLVFFALEMGAVLTKFVAKGNNYERALARRARLTEYASLVHAESERATIAHRGDLNRRIHAQADEHFYDLMAERHSRTP